MFKKIILFLLFWLMFITLFDFVDAATRTVWDDTILEAITWNNVLLEKNLPDNDDWLTLLGSIFKWIKDSLSSLVMLISIATFLFLWVRLWVARWNPEEFKKAILQLVYAVVWIFIVAAAWAIVTLVAWINI